MSHMVNTTMNHSKEFKKMKYTWIDIDAPRQEIHFKPVNESDETPEFKEPETKNIVQESTSDDASVHMLASSVYDLVKKYYPETMVVEGKRPKND